MTLFDKSEEIYKLLPKKYADIILNSVIAKSVSDGKLFQEASIFLSSKDLEELSKNLKIEQIQKKEKKVLKIKPLTEKERFKKINDEAFDDFD